MFTGRHDTSTMTGGTSRRNLASSRREMVPKSSAVSHSQTNQRKGPIGEYATDKLNLPPEAIQNFIFSRARLSTP